MDKCPLSGLPCHHNKCLHVTEVSNYEATEVKHLCVLCGLTHINEESGGQFTPPVVKQVFDMITSAIKKASEEQSSKQAVAMPAGCPTCGHTLEDIMKTSKIGCGECYNYFKKELLPIIQKCQHGATQHIGKTPKQTNPNLIKQLEAELQAAIKKEEYERAGELKKQIDKLREE
ncbi:MAG: hypothetical protein GTO02_03535 [Candidatus Dadabacteria bacterium]|nr:hypothetical protein [Candidatus Dadabacteria bacterium]